MPCKPTCICKCNTGMCECWDGTRTNKLTLVVTTISSGKLAASTINQINANRRDQFKKEKP